MKIVVPLDMSGTSEKAIEPAVDIARGLGDQIVLVTVNGPRLRADIQIQKLASSEGVDIADMIEAYLKSKSAEVAGVEVKIDTPRGEGAAEALIDYSAASDIRMIVMATHGRSGVDRWRLGSVTERVVRHSLAPVLVIPTRKPDIEEC
jgi:nucleotide-binding universal stress UspA family protein